MSSSVLHREWKEMSLRNVYAHSKYIKYRYKTIWYYKTHFVSKIKHFHPNMLRISRKENGVGKIFQMGEARTRANVPDVTNNTQ